MTTRRCAALFLFSLAIRLLAIQLTGWNTLTFGDARDYLDHARSLCDEGVYPARGNLPFFRAPGLPFFIALTTGCSGSIPAVKTALAITDALTCVLIALMASRLWRSSQAGLLAGMIAALHPFFVKATADVRSEPLFMLLLTLSIYALFAMRDDSRYVRYSVLSGSMLALAALTRPVAMAFLPLFALGAIAFSERSSRLRAPLIVAAAFALTLAPWTVRNALNSGDFIVVNDAGGYNLWRGSNARLEQLMEADTPEERHRGAIAFEAYGAEVAASIAQRAATAGERERAWRDLALQEMRADPRRVARLSAKKALLFWRPWLDPAEHSTRSVAVSGGFTLTLFALAAAGLLLLWRQDRRTALFVASLFLLAWISHVPYQVVMRFRIPITDPLLIVLGAGFVARWRAGASPAVERVARE